MQENTEQLPFETDIYALDQEFTGYDNTIVYSTSDSLECNFPYSINESSNNSYRYLEYLAIYCEDSTYSLTFEGVLKSIQTDCCLNVVFPNTTYGDGIENTYEVKLNPGMNNLSFTIENIKMTSTYNYVQFLFTNTSVKMQNYKIEVFGKNIKILNKPYKYKIFSQDDCTIISKVENNKAFEKTLKTSNLNPVQLTTPYELIKENVRDFFSYRSVFSTSGISSPIFFTKIWTDLSGALWIKNLDLAPYRCTIFNFSSICRACDTIGDKYTGITYSLSLSYGRIVLVKAITDFKSYSSNIYLTSSLETIGNFALVYDCHNLCKEIKYIFITTLTDCNNYLYLDFKSTFPALNLGFGQNVTAYFDKNSQNIIYVYMKVGNYMVKKTVEISTVTNDDGTESQNMTITNVKVIGTYDFYFETNTDVYFIVKDGTLKMFKKNTD